MSDIVTTGSTGAAAPSAAPSTPSSTPAAPSTPASATVTPSAPESSASAPASNEPPKERWDDILANTRTKTRAEVEAEYRSKYGWADQFHQDPYAFVDSWVDQLAAHPEHQSKIFAKAARLLQSRRGATPAAAPEMPKPDIPVHDANGNVVAMTYSDRQLEARDNLIWQQREAALMERLQPLEDRRQREEQREARSALQEQSQQYASQSLSKYRERWPWFKEHESSIKTYFAQHEEYGDNLAEAAQDYFAQHVYPTIGQKAESKVLADLKTQANGASISPNGSASTGTPKFKSYAEAMEYYDKHPEEALRMANR